MRFRFSAFSNSTARSRRDLVKRAKPTNTSSFVSRLQGRQQLAHRCRTIGRMTTPANELGQRRRIRTEAVFLFACNKFWNLVQRDHDDRIHKQQYMELFTRLYKLLYSPFREEDAVSVCSEDFVRDSKGNPYLNFSSFCDSLLEIAESWCRVTTLDSVCVFLVFLFESVTTTRRVSDSVELSCFAELDDIAHYSREQSKVIKRSSCFLEGEPLLSEHDQTLSDMLSSFTTDDDQQNPENPDDLRLNPERLLHEAIQGSGEQGPEDNEVRSLRRVPALQLDVGEENESTSELVDSLFTDKEAANQSSTALEPAIDIAALGDDAVAAFWTPFQASSDALTSNSQPSLPSKSSFAHHGGATAALLRDLQQGARTVWVFGKRRARSDAASAIAKAVASALGHPVLSIESMMRSNPKIVAGGSLETSELIDNIRVELSKTPEAGYVLSGIIPDVASLVSLPSFPPDIIVEVSTEDEQVLSTSESLFDDSELSQHELDQYVRWRNELAPFLSSSALEHHRLVMSVSASDPVPTVLSLLRQRLTVHGSTLCRVARPVIEPEASKLLPLSVWGEFCIVSFVERGRVVRASPEIAASYVGGQYLFCDEMCRQRFLTRPSKYMSVEPSIPENFRVFIVAAFGNSPRVQQLLQSTYDAFSASGHLSDGDEKGRFVAVVTLEDARKRMLEENYAQHIDLVLRVHQEAEEVEEAEEAEEETDSTAVNAEPDESTNESEKQTSTTDARKEAIQAFETDVESLKSDVLSLSTRWIDVASDADDVVERARKALYPFLTNEVKAVEDVDDITSYVCAEDAVPYCIVSLVNKGILLPLAQKERRTTLQTRSSFYALSASDPALEQSFRSDPAKYDVTSRLHEYVPGVNARVLVLGPSLAGKSCAIDALCTQTRLERVKLSEIVTLDSFKEAVDETAPNENDVEGDVESEEQPVVASPEIARVNPLECIWQCADLQSRGKIVEVDIGAEMVEMVLKALTSEDLLPNIVVRLDIEDTAFSQRWKNRKLALGEEEEQHADDDEDDADNAAAAIYSSSSQVCNTLFEALGELGVRSLVLDAGSTNRSILHQRLSVYMQRMLESRQHLMVPPPSFITIRDAMSYLSSGKAALSKFGTLSVEENIQSGVVVHVDLPVTDKEIEAEANAQTEEVAEMEKIADAPDLDEDGERDVERKNRHGCYAAIYMHRIWFFSSFARRDAFVKGGFLHFLDHDVSDVVTTSTCCVIGSPLSGKSSLSRNISKANGSRLLTISSVLEEAALQSTVDGRRIHDRLRNGEQLSDDLIVKALRHVTNTCETRVRGWTLDGFPCTKQQAQLMQRYGVFCDAFVTLEYADLSLAFARLKQLSELVSFNSTDAILSRGNVLHRFEKFQKNMATLKCFLDATSRVLVLDSRSSLWSQRRLVHQAFGDISKSRHDYVVRSRVGRAASLTKVASTPALILQRLSPVFQHYCVVSWVDKKQLCIGEIDSYFALYRGTVFRFCSSDCESRFLADPESYCSSKFLPDSDLPQRIPLSFAHRIKTSMCELDGYCPVSLATLSSDAANNQSIVRRGHLGCALGYQRKLYLLSSETCLQKMMKSPSSFVDVRLPLKMPPIVPRVSASDLLKQGRVFAYLQQTLEKELSQSLIEMESLSRNNSLKHPLFDQSRTAIILLALLLKANHSGSDSEMRLRSQRFRERLQEFLRQCSLSNGVEGGGIQQLKERWGNLQQSSAAFVQIFDR